MRCAVGLCLVFALSSLGCATPSATPVDADNDWEQLPVPSTWSVCHDGSGDFTTIQDALDHVPDNSLVGVCAGTYHENIVHYSKVVALVSSDGDGAAIIDGGGIDRALRVRNVPEPGFTLNGFTIQNGAAGYHGGGMYVKYSVLNLENNSFIDNSADGDGGGLWVGASTVDISGNHFEGNLAYDDGGGATIDTCTGTFEDNTLVENEADDGGALSTEQGGVLISGNSFERNVAQDIGGAIFMIGDAWLVGNTIADNIAWDDGGGFFLYRGDGLIQDNVVTGNWCEDDGGGGYTSRSASHIVGNTFQYNSADDDAGGLRIYVGNDALIEDNDISYNVAHDAGGGVKMSHAEGIFRDNTVIGNVTGDRGGGIELDNDTSLISGCLVQGNTAALGGGLHSQLNHSPQTIEDSSFIDNAAEDGAGIMLEEDSYRVTLERLVFTGNSAEHGGALYALDSTFWAFNQIAADNSATDEGGGFALKNSNALLQNATFWGNAAPSGAGVHLRDNQTFTLRSSIFAAHEEGSVIRVKRSPTTAISTIDLWDNSNGVYGIDEPAGTDGNVEVDPMFVDADSYDFQLQTGSPVIDAGEPGTYDTDGSAADMGAYGGPYATWQ